MAANTVLTDRYDNGRKSIVTLVMKVKEEILMLGEFFFFVINKLERGNSVLKNSMQAISPMWVILNLMESLMVRSNNSHYSYVYDSLCLVDTKKIERGRYGKLVFKFALNRILDNSKLVLPLRIM